MDQTRTKRMMDTALIATLALSGLGASIPTARGDEVPNLTISAAKENNAYGPFSVFRSEGTPSDNSDENLSNEGVAMPSEEGPSNLQNNSEEGEETDGSSAVIVGSTIRVFTIGQLKQALADSTYKEIVLTDNIQSISEDLTIDRDVVLNLNKNMLMFDKGGALSVTGGNVEVRNGSIYSYETEYTRAAIIQTGGVLTLAGGLNINPSYINGVVTQGNASLIINDAEITCHSEKHAAINAQGSSSVVAERVKLNTFSNATAVLESSDADVTLKLGTYYSTGDIVVSPYVAEGYTLVNDGSNFTYSKGDINGSLANISVSPDTYTYDGTSKEPTVTVTFDGKDVTNECFITYEDNREPGTASVKVKARATSDTITAEASRSFTIESTDPSPDPDPDPDPEPDSEPEPEPDPGTATLQAKVRTLAQLKSALENSTIKEIVLEDNIESIPSDLVINRSIILNLNKKILSFTSNGGEIHVAANNVEIRNGYIICHSGDDEDAAIVVESGNLTLGENLDVDAKNTNTVLTRGKSTLTIDGAALTCRSERHSLIKAEDTSTVDGKKLKLLVYNNSTAVTKEPNSKVSFKLGSYYTDNEKQISPYLASGYKMSSYVSGLYQSRANIDTSVVSISLDSDTYTYDGKSKEPEVKVTLDGEDVTNECFITYENNIDPGTATVKITAMATSDNIMGETTRKFTINPGTIDGSNADISLATTSYTYNGSKHEPHVTVKVNGSTVLSTNYTVTYSNNIDAGTATATVTFKSDSGYTGTVSENFTINQKEATVTPNSKSKRAGESDPELTATVTGTVGSDKLSYKLSRNSGESTGTYTITASGSSSQGNYKVTFKTGTFTITGSNSTNSTTTTSSTSSSNKSNGNTTTSSTNTTKNNSSTPTSNTSTSASAASTGSDRATNSTGATSSTGTTGTTGAATATKAASTGTAAPVAKTPATADPSFVGFGTLVSSAFAALGIGLGTKRRSKE